MTRQEVEILSNKLIALSEKCSYEDYTKTQDPFRAFNQGFDLAIECALEAIGSMVKEGYVTKDI